MTLQLACTALCIRRCTLATSPAEVLLEAYMSFPSAGKFLAEGLAPEAALLKAMQTDTHLGWIAIKAVAEASTMPQGEKCPCCHVKSKLVFLGQKDSVLRHERRGDGVMIDFDPGSKVGGQIARLLGTDAARPIVSKYLELNGALHVGFANCCKVIVSSNPDDVTFSAAEQIAWQSKIDC